MRTRVGFAAVLVAALALPLTGCAGAATPPSAPSTPAPSPTLAEPTPSADPTAEPTVEPSATPETGWEQVSTENGLVSIEIPTAWSVERLADEIESSVWSQALLVRNADGELMTQLWIGEGGDRGGACVTLVDGVMYPDDDSMLPAEIHHTETMLIDGLPSSLVAATVTGQDPEADPFFHVGFLPEEPVEGLVPCLWYDDIATPEGFPNLTFGTPYGSAEAEHWSFDSAAAGAAYTQTEEYALLMHVMRSLELHR